MKINSFSYTNLRYLHSATPVEALPQDKPTVIFSDFHMGDGSKKDDFSNNAELTVAVLEEYYRRGYRIVLNGDIEELQKFNRDRIQQQWAAVFKLFERFYAEDRLIRLVGNHDMQLLFDPNLGMPIYESLRWQCGADSSPDELFVFHGHQTSRWYALFNDQAGAAIKYLLGPLPVKNFSVSHDNRKKKRLEERVYGFSSRQGIVSIIGHTHRPLFESLSKIDYVKYNIERLCRQYSTASADDQQRIHGEIQDLKRHLLQTVPDSRRDFGSIYHEDFVVPCVFNSGCVLGKRGITCLEIKDNGISLMYWFDRDRSKRYLRYEGYDTRQLPGTDYYETTIKNEQLDYIFSRIRLLA